MWLVRLNTCVMLALYSIGEYSIHCKLEVTAQALYGTKSAQAVLLSVVLAARKNRHANRCSLLQHLPLCLGLQAVYDDEVYNIVALSTPVSPVWNIGRLNNKWTHYEQVRQQSGCGAYQCCMCGCICCPHSVPPMLKQP